MLETDNHCLTRFCYVKSNNCFELYESMESIKALLKLSETLDHIKPTREKIEYLIPQSEPNESNPQTWAVNIHKHNAYWNCPKSFKKFSSCLIHLRTLIFYFVEPLTFLWFVPCLWIGEHSIRVLLRLSWGEREVYDVKNHGEIVKVTWQHWIVQILELSKFVNLKREKKKKKKETKIKNRISCQGYWIDC